MSKADADPGFADRLQQAMLRRDLSSSDLARLMWGLGVEKGYTVARNRQIIGRYLEGNVYPRRKNRRRLSEALDIPYDDLFPHEASNRSGSGIAMKPVGPQTILLELSVALPVAVAWTIVEMALKHERAGDPDPGDS